MLTLPERLNLAQRNTPLQLLSRLSAQLGVRIWVKRDDLTGCALTGNKVRKLEFVLAAALKRGCDTLITCGGVQSNHCRATALIASQLGLKAHLILRGEADELDGNLLLDHLAGAEISYYPAKRYLAELPSLFEHWQRHYQQQGRKPWSIPTGASDGIGLWGYVACAQELAEDCRGLGIEPAGVVCASGSGGTQAGLTVGLADAFAGRIPVLGIAVSDDASYFQAKVAEDIEAWQRHYGIATAVWLNTLNIDTTDDYVGPGYGVATKAVFDTIRQLAQLEGLLLDPVYTGKAFYGLLQEIERGRFKPGADVVFIHTGGLFGLFAQKRQLLTE